MKTVIKIQYLIILILLAISSDLYAKKNVNEPDRIAVYNFKVIKNIETTTEKKPESPEITNKNFEYYSFIIPQSVFKSLSKEYGYDVIRKLNYLEIDEDSAKTKKTLLHSGKTELVNFLVSGICTINKDNIEISVTIFDTRGLEKRTFTVTTDETGVFFRKVTESIASGLNSHIAEINKLNAEKFRPSPIAPLFGPLRNISLGIEAGYVKILGEYKNSYNDTYFISPGITYNLNKNFGLKMAFDYLETNSDNKDTTSYLELSYQAYTLGLIFKIQPGNSNISIDCTVSGGIANTKVFIDSSEPFTAPSGEESSWDPYMSTSLDLSYNMKSAYFKIGGVYRQVFYKDKNLYLVGGQFGFGLYF